MTWAMYHTKSEYHAHLAEEAIALGNINEAYEQYRYAAELEELALQEIGPNKLKTLGITTVSAASLWLKANNLEKARIVAFAGSMKPLPAFALSQLQNIIQTAWNEEARARSGITFSKGEILVSVAGGTIVPGGAPLDLILRKVDEIGRYIYRIIEMLLNKSLRRKGSPSQEIQEQYRPWLFQAPTGSYQFAVGVQKPKQMTFFPSDGPSVDEIISTFLRVIRASADDPQTSLDVLVKDAEYRDVFIKLTRNLAPTGTVFDTLELKSSETGTRPVVLKPVSRVLLNQTLKARRVDQQIEEETSEELRGVLRGLELNKDWLEISIAGEKTRNIRILDTGDIIDDTVGPLVNRRVIVTAVKLKNNKYRYVDIQPEE